MARVGKSDFIRQQALASKHKNKITSEMADKTAQARQILTDLVTKTVTQQQQIQRLAKAYADRCHRVHELYGQLESEWIRANAAEATADEWHRKYDEINARICEPQVDRDRLKSVPSDATG